MPDGKQMLQTLAEFSNWLGTCMGLPLTTPACRPLWQWLMYVSAGVGAALLLWVIWRIIDYRLKYAAAIRAQIERERIAPPEIMEQVKFREADLTEDVTDPHLAAKIRAELERQRLEK